MKFKIKYADQIVGILSIVAIAALIFIIFLIGTTQKWFVPKHNYYTIISSASISEGKAIQYKGFEIGKVKSVSLTEEDKVRVDFYISDEYINKVTENSIIEISVSPIGLGSSVIFYPGNSAKAQEEDTFIPEKSSAEAKILIKEKKVFVAEQSDSINNIIASATTLLGDLDGMIKQINMAVEGNNDTELSRTLIELNKILSNIADITKTGDGLIPKLLEDEESKGSIAKLLETLNLALSDVNGITTGFNGEMNNISILISQVQQVLKEAQAVLEGLKNNPLIKNGVSVKPEKESATPKLREDNF